MKRHMPHTDDKTNLTRGKKILTRVMWNYLRKYQNNHAKNSLPPETRSNASTDARIWESEPATLNPLNYHCYRFALDHHLFNHKLSPYDEKEAKLINSPHIDSPISV